MMHQRRLSQRIFNVTIIEGSSTYGFQRINRANNSNELMEWMLEVYQIDTFNFRLWNIWLLICAQIFCQRSKYDEPNRIK